MGTPAAPSSLPHASHSLFAGDRAGDRRHLQRGEPPPPRAAPAALRTAVAVISEDRVDPVAQQPSAAPQPNAASCAAGVPAGSPPITDRTGFTPLVRRTSRPAELRRMRIDWAAVRVPNGPGLHLSVHWGQESPTRTGEISSGPIIGGDDDGADQSFRHARTGREVAAADRGRRGRGAALRASTAGSTCLLQWQLH
jgi:hypothetical protein